jgi:hypothetical protein
MPAALLCVQASGAGPAWIRTAARKAAAEASVAQRTRFDTASAKELPGVGYDLVCLFSRVRRATQTPFNLILEARP